MNDTIDIIRHSSEPFADRKDAGKQLGMRLKTYDLEAPLILGIPRGGAVIADAAANVLDAEMDIVLAAKLGAPGNPEFAVGAMSETGEVYLNPDTGISEDSYLEEEKQRKHREIVRRKRRFRNVRPQSGISGRNVIVADDGLATGSTMQAALWSMRNEGAQKVIAAIPVASESALKKISESANKVLCLRLPGTFMAVGQFYDRFDQTDDEEVITILRKHAREKETK